MTNVGQRVTDNCFCWVCSVLLGGKKWWCYSLPACV